MKINSYISWGVNGPSNGDRLQQKRGSRADADLTLLVVDMNVLVTACQKAPRARRQYSRENTAVAAFPWLYHGAAS